MPETALWGSLGGVFSSQAPDETGWLAASADGLEDNGNWNSAEQFPEDTQQAIDLELDLQAFGTLVWVTQVFAHLRPHLASVYETISAAPAALFHVEVQPINAELAVEVTYPCDENAIEAVQQLCGNLVSALLVPICEWAAENKVTVPGISGYLRGDTLLLLAILVVVSVYFSTFSAPLRRTEVDSANCLTEEATEEARLQGRSAFDPEPLAVSPQDLRILSPEHGRLSACEDGVDWKKWGPYVSERHWGTCREDYAPHGNSWIYLPFEAAHFVAYRWGEDGLAGWCDKSMSLCLGLALWNGKDAILKERLYGLSNPQGNHGEDVKELYYYLDATPTHSYLKMMYKYPQAKYPYDELRRVNFERKKDPMLLEYELLDTGVLDDNKYFDVVVEYVQAEPEDTMVLITAENRGDEEAELCLLPQAWFRNTWSWGQSKRPSMTYIPAEKRIELVHEKLGTFNLYVDESAEVIFCENDTNDARAQGGALSPYQEEPAAASPASVGDFRSLEPAAWHALHARFGTRLGPAPQAAQETGQDRGFPYHLSGRTTGTFKDGFHNYVIRNEKAAVSTTSGTKAGLLTRHKVAAGSRVTARLRLAPATKSFAKGAFSYFDELVQQRRADTDRFYSFVQEDIHQEERRLIHRQALAGMVWTKQLYYYDIRTWLQGDEGKPKPPSRGGRNEDWDHLYNLDVISMPDKWEYPWYATWDLAFHCIPLALVDAAFAKEQLRLMTLERFMHPNGQLPAYEWNFNDVNPPVHAWAVWRVFQMDRKHRGDAGDLGFLEELFHKLMLNFQWWVNRKDAEGRNIFQGGFLGLDNIGVVDRSQPFPNGGMINQSDGTSWMAYYSLTLMRMALELALNNPVYESIACKFLEHFLHIARAMTKIANNAEHGLWDPVDEFYYDVLANPDGVTEPIKLRSIVGLIPLFAVEVLEPDMLRKLPRFASQMQWLFDNRPDLASLVSRFEEPGRGERRLLSLLRGYRMRALLKRMLDPEEFLSDYGIRTALKRDIARHRVAYIRMITNNTLLASVKLLASDLDGTLLNPHHEPAAGTFEAIAEYQGAGGSFAVCTGRDLGSARGVLKGLDIDRMPGVYLNGTTVKGKGGELLRNLTLPAELLHKMVDWGRAHRDVASILFVEGDAHYVMDRSEEYALFMHKHLLDPDPIQVKGGWESATPDIPTKVNMMRVICHPDKMDIVKPQVAACVEGLAAYAQSLPTTIDIMAPRTNKAAGLRVLLEELGLSMAECCAIGDSENDLEMLQSVRVACAMGNAVKKTKAVSHFVMPRNTDAPPGVVSLLKSLTQALTDKAEADKADKADKAEASEAASGGSRVACFSVGSWGMGVARQVGQSLLHLKRFEEALPVWVPAEETALAINGMGYDERHLPGLRLPSNILATTDPVEAAKDADLLIFVVFDQMEGLLQKLKGKVKSTATAVVMSKVLMPGEKVLKFGSEYVSEVLGANAAVLMGGTLAADVARGYFAEATLGCKDEKVSQLLLELFNKPNFSVAALSCPLAVELFAVLKSIISIAAGFCDGLSMGHNTKAAVIRLGAVELAKFAQRFYPQQSSKEALTEACGLTDIIASSYGDSRTRRCAEAFAKEPTKGWDQVAREHLRSGMPSGIGVAQTCAAFVRNHHAEAEFPFLAKVDSICGGKAEVASLTEMAIPRVRSSKAMKVAFQKNVPMWVHEDHENVKYLPGVELPHNLYAEPDARAAVQDAHILVFVLPHQFLPSLLKSIKGAVLPDAVAVSLIKGYLEIDRQTGSLRTGTQLIETELNISCAVLNGANVANDVAHEHFAEATLGCSNEAESMVLWNLLNSEYFSVRSTRDVLGVELCGGFKNVVALAAGFSDGLGFPANTKAAILRRGLGEIARLIQELFPTSSPDTLLESCGLADLLTTCYSGRNRRCAQAFAEDPESSWEQIEAEQLQGQKLQGPSTCIDVQSIIQKRGLEGKFPLFTAIHKAVMKEIKPEEVFNCIGIGF
ncbi:unnamed protein product [Effrenium voratum]|nr:unnamed protein product [Effrenium voratum]